MDFHLKVPAPYTLPYANIPNCVATQAATLDADRTVNSIKREHFKVEEGKERLDRTGLLPALPRHKAHPQTFIETVDFSKPSRFPFWFEMEQEDEEFYYDDEEWGSGMNTSVSSPQFLSTIRSQQEEKPLPPDYLSPFALQVRQKGGDVVVTGKKLDKLVKKPHFDDFGEPPVENKAAVPSLGSDSPKETKRQFKESPFKNMKPPKERPAWKPPAKTDTGWRTQERKGSKQKRDSSSSSRNLRGSTSHGFFERSTSAPQLQGGRTVPGGTRSRHPLAALEGGPRAEQQVAVLSQQPSQPSLPTGHAELWNGQEKLSAVRDLLDGYAADPLRASPPRRPAGAASGTTEDGRPNSSTDFFAAYLERQAEIERMLRQKAVPLQNGPLGE